MNILLAEPRGFCAGVVRAIDIVRTALRAYEAPVYVLHEIVHNRRVVSDLRSEGAVFVESLADIPRGAPTVFSAHGVSGHVFTEARDRGLEIVDATCPLVAKVHLEVVRHARAGREVVLIGHAGHPEVRGTLGRYESTAGGRIYLVESVADAEALSIEQPQSLAYVTQTTLSVDETRRIVEVLRRRFPAIEGPKKDDICYATQNRQNAVRELASRVKLLLVVGARNSSNSNRLRELGAALGVRSELIEDASDLQRHWFEPKMPIGITAGASAPEKLVEEVIERLQGWFSCQVDRLPGESEQITFALPAMPNGRASKVKLNNPGAKL